MNSLQMPRAPLGQTGLEISRVGFGAWAIGGGGYQFGWGDQEDADSVAAIHEAIAQGVNWIDTAAVYGLGRSERVVAQALAGLAERPYLFTKGGRVAEGSADNIVGNVKRDSLRREVEASLERLGVDTIDLYQLHWPDPDADIEEGWSALAELKGEGILRHIGVSNFNPAQMTRLQAIAPIETLQPPYSLIARGVEAEILPFAALHQIGVIVYSPMASGMLSGAMTRERIERLPEGDWRRRHARFREPELSRNLEIVSRLERVAERYDTTPGAVAVAWTLGHSAVDAAILGLRDASQVAIARDAATLVLTERDRAELEAD